ncbi:MAG: DUF819 family protein [Bacillota bacterium]|nr:DUF819 family protein [Bacillota bacterium]
MIYQNWILAIIVLVCATLAYVLQNKYDWARKISGCMIALILGMILSNTNLVVSDAPVYDFVWDYVLPFSLPFLLWNANIKHIFKDSKRLLGIYLISSLGTLLGVVLAIEFMKNMLPNIGHIGAMMCGTYIGGSVNLVAIASLFNVDQSVLSASIVADNFLMVLYFLVLVGLPNMPFIKKHFKQRKHKRLDSDIKENKVSMKSILLGSVLSLAIVWISKSVSSLFGQITATNIFLELLITLLKSQYIWITTCSVFCATFFSRKMQAVQSSKIVGEYLMHVFFVVIGIPASLIMILTNMPLLFLFNFIIVFVNLMVTLIGGKLFNYSVESICVASNANIGGPTTAAAYATSQGWDGLVVPAVLVGTLGYVIGNYAGILIGTFL